MKISVVINTYNEEKNISRCLESVKGFADEIIVVDMHSADKTVEIAKKYGAQVFEHEYTRYVEPARNFALSRATGDWILLIDADEELSGTLRKKLEEIIENNVFDYIEIPRKNIIFGKWIEYSRWWPDCLVRFFRKGKVKFSDEIHVPPVSAGEGTSLEAKEENALIHHNFQTIFQFIERLNRYSDIQSEELAKNGYKFNWKDLVIKPSNEFFSRFFAGNGYKDGLHGLALAMLQSFSEATVYLKVWEKEGFPKDNLSDVNQVFEKIINDFLYWMGKLPIGLLKKIHVKIKAKI